VSARLGDDEFDAPVRDEEIPDFFDLEMHARTVRVRIDPSAIDWLPTPNRLGPMTDAPDGQVDVDITVYGERRLENLLLVLPAGTQVLGPSECADIRRRCATQLLALYD
jgi:hypothetical protein